MMGGNGLNSTEMYKVAGPAADGVVVGAAWFIDGKYTGNLEFVKRFKAKYGTTPDQFAAQAYAGAASRRVAGPAGRDHQGRNAGWAAQHARGQHRPRTDRVRLNRDVRAAPVILQITKDGFAYL